MGSTTGCEKKKTKKMTLSLLLVYKHTASLCTMISTIHEHWMHHRLFISMTRSVAYMSMMMVMMMTMMMLWSDLCEVIEHYFLPL